MAQAGEALLSILHMHATWSTLLLVVGPSLDTLEL